MKCEECEWLYISSSVDGVCHKHCKEVERCSNSCLDFERRRKNIVPILDEVARHLAEGKDVVIMDNGFPSYKISTGMNITNVEIVLRMTLIPDHEYIVV